MKAPLPLLALALALSSAAPADARRDRRHLRPLAHSEIREMTSVTERRVIRRALVGVEETRPYLVVETFRRGRTEGDRDQLVQQQRFDELAVGRSTISTDQLTEIRDLRWVRGGLEFTASGHRGDLSCTFAVRRRARTPRCVPMNAGVGQPPPVDRPQGPYPLPPHDEPWSQRPDVIRACGDTFSGQSNEAACLRAVASAHHEPVALIRACDQAMEGDTNELACVREVAAARGDVTGAIARCDAAMEGDTNELACIRLLASDSRARSIADACDAAMEGDSNELRCIEMARGLSGDVARTIAACDDAAAGDRAELACVQAAYGRHGAR